MRFAALIFLSSAAFGSAAAAGPPSSVAPDIKASVHAALQSMMAPEQANQKVDRDQGDDHAALRAIAVVCSHDNPSATRSAICPVPVSPD